MAENQSRIPSDESIAIFLRFTKGKPSVSSIEEVERQVYEIRRGGKSDLKVFLTNAYIVSEADVHDVTATHSDLDAIVTLSMWNSYSKDAKRVAQQMGVAVFTLSEFMGAIYFDGDGFLDYKPPDHDKRGGRGRDR